MPSEVDLPHICPCCRRDCKSTAELSNYEMTFQLKNVPGSSPITLMKQITSEVPTVRYFCSVCGAVWHWRIKDLGVRNETDTCHPPASS